MAHIIVQLNLYKYHFSVNLASDIHQSYAQKDFKNPVKALAYVGQLQALGHVESDAETVSKLVELARLWQDNSN